MIYNLGSDHTRRRDALQAHFHEPVVVDELPGEAEAQLVAEVQRLQSINSQLTVDNDKLRETNTDLRTRLMAALRDDGRTAICRPTLDSSAHSVLASRFRHLVTQDLTHLVREHQRTERTRNGAWHLATLLSTLTRELFVHGANRPVALCDKLGMDSDEHLDEMADALAKVNALRREAKDVRWDLDAIHGRRVNPNFQEPWGQCDPQTTVEFAVVPAYRVDERVYAKQLVFTKRSRFGR